MLKKKNNLICMIMIITALISGISTVILDYNLNSNSSAVTSLSTNSNNLDGDNPFGNNDSSTNNSTNPFGNSDSSIFPTTANNQNSKYRISILATCSIIICALIASLAIIYLIMSKLSQHQVFINNDKKWIYGLSRLLTYNLDLLYLYKCYQKFWTVKLIILLVFPIVVNKAITMILSNVVIVKSVIK